MVKRLNDGIGRLAAALRRRPMSFRLPGGSLFSSPKAPRIPPPPPIPEPDDGEHDRRERLLAEKRRRGVRSTILTGALGVLDDAQVNRPTLG